jgi:uncharacterized protein (DUF169 family)
MDVKTLNRIGKSLNEILRLKTTPVGIKLFENISEIPKNFQMIEKKLVICGVIGLARYYNIAVAITKENTQGICPGADISLGIGSLPENFAQMAVGGMAETVEGAENVLKGRVHLSDDKYQAFGVAPIDTMLIEPDIVQIWGNPLQMIVLAYSNTWFDGGYIGLSTNGHGASCYEVLSVPFMKKEIRYAIADMGDRRHGFAGDDDMILGVPISKLRRLYEGLEKIQNTRDGFPVLYNFEDVPFPIPNSVLGRKFPHLR